MTGLSLLPSGRWAKSLRVGRVQLSIEVLRHSYPTGPDRWVVLPRLIFDRKGDSL